MGGVRLLIDADVPILLARTLRQRGHDVLHALEVGLREAKDPAVMAAAVALQRTVMTHNVDDYVAILSDYGRRGQPHWGVVFAQQLEFRELLARTLNFLSERTSDDMRDATVWLGVN